MAARRRRTHDANAHPLDAALASLAAWPPAAALAAAVTQQAPPGPPFGALTLPFGRRKAPGDAKDATLPVPTPAPPTVDVSALPPPPEVDAASPPHAATGMRLPWSRRDEAHPPPPPPQPAPPPPTPHRSFFGLPSVRLPALPYFVSLAPPGHPDKAALVSVADFFEYARSTARALFDEMDSDGDAWVTEADVRRALSARGLPPSAAPRLVAAARGKGRWWSARFSWPEFAALCAAREPAVLRAYTALAPDRAGRVDAAAVKAALARAGADASDAAAAKLLASMGVEGGDGAASYAQFRSVVALLPHGGGASGAAPAPGDDGPDPATAWFDAASLVQVGPPAGAEDVVSAAAAAAEGGARPARRAAARGALVQAALAGGLVNAASVLMSHPLDTLKSRLQAAGAGPASSVLAAARAAPPSRLYAGILPATAGAFCSHGLRVLAYEASLGRLLAGGGAASAAALAGGSALRAQALASAVGTALGTAVRIPTDVLKQRCQVGTYPNAAAALSAAVRAGGLPGSLFVSTVPLLAREVIFYSVGVVFFTRFKALADGAAASGGTPARDLSRHEMIALGAAAGAAASLFTTPCDVIKTRVATAALGSRVDAATALAALVRGEGVLALWRGALPRALWVAPMGAMNFAGTELMKRSLDERAARREKTAAVVA